jgi:hypothetical protein
VTTTDIPFDNFSYTSSVADTGLSEFTPKYEHEVVDIGWKGQSAGIPVVHTVSRYGERRCGQDTDGMKQQSVRGRQVRSSPSQLPMQKISNTDSVS